MSANSPAEYVEQLRAENRALRRGLIEEVHTRQALEGVVAQQSAYIIELYRQKNHTRYFDPMDVD